MTVATPTYLSPFPNCSTAGTIRTSNRVARKGPRGGKRLVRRQLAEALGISADAEAFVAYRDARSGLEYLRSGRDLHEHGLSLHLDAYQGHVFWEFRDLRDGSAGQWRRLAEQLGGAGVPSLEAALDDLLLEPVHAPLRAMFDGSLAGLLVEERVRAFYAAVASATDVGGDPAALARSTMEGAARLEDVLWPEATPEDVAVVMGWQIVAPLGALSPGADVAVTIAAWFDEL